MIHRSVYNVSTVHLIECFLIVCETYACFFPMHVIDNKLRIVICEQSNHPLWIWTYDHSTPPPGVFRHTVFSEVNEERGGNGLPEIKVTSAHDYNM